MSRVSQQKQEANATKDIQQKKEILINHLLDLEQKNEKYLNHVKGDCLCNICLCGKCICRNKKLQTIAQTIPQSIYMRSYSPPNKNYNIGNGDIKETVDQTKTVLNLRSQNCKISTSSKSLESRTIVTPLSDDLQTNNSLSNRDITNYSPRMLKYGYEKPFYDPLIKERKKQFTDEELHQLCQKTNFERNLEGMAQATQAKSENNYKTSNDPIIQLQELPPNVRSIPFKINSFARVQTHKMFEELNHLKDNLNQDQKSSNSNIKQEINNENDKSIQNLSNNDLVKFLNRHRSFSPNQRNCIQNDDYDKEKVSEKIKQVMKRKNDLTQKDFINYAQKVEKLQKTVFSCYDKFIEEESAYKTNHCNQSFQNKVIKITQDQEYNFNQVDNLINENVQKINKVGYFQRIPAYEGQFNSTNQIIYHNDPRKAELCPTRKAKTNQSPRQEAQNCKDDDLELLPKKYYNHRYYRPVKQATNQSKQGSKIVKVKIDPQKADIPAFINQFQQQKMQEKIKTK